MSRFAPDLLLLLHDVARLLRVHADKRARMHAMTRAQWVMLIWLDRQPGISQKELSEVLEVEPITVARLVDRLEQRGMVERRPDPRDRRIWRLHLTEAATPLIAEIEAERAEMARLLTDGLDETVQRQVLAALGQMKATLCAEVRCGRRERDVAPAA